MTDKHSLAIDATNLLSQEEHSHSHLDDGCECEGQGQHGSNEFHRRECQHEQRSAHEQKNLQHREEERGASVIEGKVGALNHKEHAIGGQAQDIHHDDNGQCGNIGWLSSIHQHQCNKWCRDEDDGRGSRHHQPDDAQRR